MSAFNAVDNYRCKDCGGRRFECDYTVPHKQKTNMSSQQEERERNKNYQEAFKQEFGIHFSESELQFALAFIEEVRKNTRKEAAEEIGKMKDIFEGATLGDNDRAYLGAITDAQQRLLGGEHLPDRPINSERD